MRRGEEGEEREKEGGRSGGKDERNVGVSSHVPRLHSAEPGYKTR